MTEQTPEPFDAGRLDVGDGHVLYYEQVGQTGTGDDVDWLTVHAGRFFPAEWQEFRDHVPAELSGLRLVDAYHALLMDRDPAARDAAAAAWCRWEDAHVTTTPGATPNPRYDDAGFRLGFARQVTHCWRHNSWLTDDEIVRNAGRLAGIRGWLIHGRLDVSSPLDAPCGSIGHGPAAS